MKSVAIIGGGITGLTAAYRLQQKGIPVTVYEAGSRTGGVIQTVREDGFLAECGPNSILETSPVIAGLVEDLGLASRRLYSSPESEKRFIVRRGKPVCMPSSLPDFLRTPLFSMRAKLRLCAEPFIGRAPADEEEGLARFVVRRLGREFLDYAIDPFVAGVYAGNPARLSVKEAFPKLHAIEQKYGSLILGQFLGARERRRRAEVSKQSAPKFSFDEGLQVLVDTLRLKLGDSVRTNCRVDFVSAAPGGWRVVTHHDCSEELRYHSAVVYAGTAEQLSRLQVVSENSVSLAPLGNIHHPPIVSVVLGFRRSEVRHPLDGFGMLIPQAEHCNSLGTLFTSTLFPGRAPDGYVTLSSYIGGARNPELALEDPDKIVRLVLADLQKLLGVSGGPVYQHQFFHRRAIPQYEIGYGKMRELMNQFEAHSPGFFLAGHYREGISLGDSIVSGHKAAGRIEEYLAAITKQSVSDESSTVSST